MGKMTVQEQDRRERQRRWRSSQLLESKNEYGVSDPTPKAAVKNIVNGKMEYITTRLQ